MIASAAAGMAASTGFAVEILGVDRTADRFRSVEARLVGLNRTVAGFAAKFRSFGLALAPLAALGVAAKKAAEAFRELSALTDRAADAGTSAPMLQKLVGAMRQVGVRGADLDTVSRAMQNMARTTGEVGAEGFAKVLGQASRLGTEAERLDFLAKAFGRTQGAVFASIVRDGGQSLQALLDLAAGYPAVSDAAAQGGDRAADAMARASDAIKASWQQMCGDAVIRFEAAFGPLPEIAASIARGIMIAFKAIGDTVRAVSLVVRGLIEPLIRLVASLLGAVANLYRAATDAGYSMRDALVDSWQGTKDQFIDMWEGWKETAEPLFDFSNIAANAETKPVFDAMREAVAAGGVTFRKEAEKASDAVARKPVSTRQEGPPFAQAMGFGSAAVSQLLFGNRTQDIQSRALGEARRTNDILSRIDGTLAGLEAV